MASDEDLEDRVDRIERAVGGLTEAVEMMVDDREVDEVVENVSTGARTRVKFTRGTGTRDQEEYTIVGKGEDAAKALEELDEQMDAIEEEYVDRIRAIQPVEDDEDG